MYLDQNPTSQNITKLQISPGSFVIKEEREQRNNSILSIAGVIFAYYGSAAGFYVFLFGINEIKYWGVVHKISDRKNLEINDKNLNRIIIKALDEMNNKEKGSEEENT
ncbi:4906_t:CDS:2, partial [Dentiscutata heterogama]